MTIPDSLIKAFSAIVSEKNVTTEIYDRIVYSQSCTFEPAGTPSVVVRPQSTDDVIKIIRLLNKHKQPVWIWGRGTLFVGSGVKDDFVIMDMTALNEILQIDTENLCVTVQAGMTWGAVNSELRKQGWELTVQGSGGLVSATVGGTIAANAVPHGLTKGGMTADGILNLEVVLTDGTIIQTGSASNPDGRPFFRFGNGPDLAGLFIGSCGAFGVITQATLKIQKLPEKESFHCYGFSNFQTAFQAVTKMQQEECTRFIVAIQGDLPEEIAAQTVLHVVVDGKEKQTEENAHLVDSICKEFQGQWLDNTGTKNYWASHDVMYSWLRWKSKEQYYRWRSGSRPYFCPEVTAVLPYPEITRFTQVFWDFWNSLLEKNPEIGAFLKGYDIYFARGGGSIWIDSLYPSDNQKSIDFGIQTQKELFELVLQHGGAVPLIGAGVQAEYTMPRLGKVYDLLKMFKRNLDPHGILNPGVLSL